MSVDVVTLPKRRLVWERAHRQATAELDRGCLPSWCAGGNFSKRFVSRCPL